MSVAVAHKLFKASEAITAEAEAKRAAYFATAPHQPGDVIHYGRFFWTVLRVSATGGGDLLYIVERIDLIGSRFDILASNVE